MIPTRNLAWLFMTAFCLAIAASFYESWAGKPTTDKTTVNFRAKMNQLSTVLGRLIPNVASEKKFQDPANYKDIESDAKTLSMLAHELKGEMPASIEGDPSTQMISGAFAREASRAVLELKRGNRAYARSQLKTITGYCISCHTRTGDGKGTNPLSIPLDQLLPFERAEYLTAARDYDEALKIFGKIISDVSVRSERPLEWNRAVRYSLSIAVRVKNDPEKARVLVEDVRWATNVPQFMKENAKAWINSIAEWKKEKPIAKDAKEEALYQEAVRLVARARSVQDYPLDQSGDLDYLRATAVLHTLLTRYPVGNRVSQALLLSGICYEAIRDLSIWTLHEMYYEACIRKLPHSDVSQSCYRRLEQSVFAGFSGSAGIFIPLDVKTHLNEMEALAKTGSASPSP